MLMTLLGREVPECDAELLFSDIELRFLADYAADAALPVPRDLAGAVLLVAVLGGYQNRKHDPPPGHQIKWRGYERLALATLGYRIAERRGRAEWSVRNSRYNAALTRFLAEVQRDVRRHVVVRLPTASWLHLESVPDVDLIFTLRISSCFGVPTGYLHEIHP